MLALSIELGVSTLFYKLTYRTNSTIILIPNRPYLWDEADMDVAEVLPLDFELELSEGFNERHALNVSHGPSKLFQNETMNFHTRDTDISIY